MSCTTKELVNYVKEKYVAKDKTKEGIEFLLRVLGTQTKYKTELVTLLAQSYSVNRANRLNILENRVPLNNSTYSFLQLLDFILREEGKYIFVKKDKEILDNFSTYIGGTHPRKYPTTKAIKSAKRKRLFKNIKKRKILVFIVFFISASFIFFLFRSGNYTNPINFHSNTTSTEYSSNEYDENGYRSPLNQITTWYNKDATQWALWLENFDELDAAIRVQEAYQRIRDIKILYLEDDDKYHLLIFRETEAEVRREHSQQVKDRWKKSLIIPVDKCYLTQGINHVYFTCKAY